jgi:hypothetical protein
VSSPGEIRKYTSDHKVVSNQDDKQESNGTLTNGGMHINQNDDKDANGKET